MGHGTLQIGFRCPQQRFGQNLAKGNQVAPIGRQGIFAQAPFQPDTVEIFLDDRIRWPTLMFSALPANG